MIRTASVKVDIRSTVLYHNVLQDIGHVLAAIDGDLEEIVNFFELDQPDGILFFIEQVRNGASSHAVGLVFEATIDSCEDVADVLQNVVVKNS